MDVPDAETAAEALAQVDAADDWDAELVDERLRAADLDTRGDDDGDCDDVAHTVVPGDIESLGDGVADSDAAGEREAADDRDADRDPAGELDVDAHRDGRKDKKPLAVVLDDAVADGLCVENDAREAVGRGDAVPDTERLGDCDACGELLLVAVPLPDDESLEEALIERDVRAVSVELPEGDNVRTLAEAVAVALAEGVAAGERLDETLAVEDILAMADALALSDARGEREERGDTVPLREMLALPEEVAANTEAEWGGECVPRPVGTEGADKDGKLSGDGAFDTEATLLALRVRRASDRDELALRVPDGERLELRDTEGEPEEYLDAVAYTEALFSDTDCCSEPTETRDDEKQGDALADAHAEAAREKDAPRDALVNTLRVAAPREPVLEKEEQRDAEGLSDADRDERADFDVDGQTEELAVPVRDSATERDRPCEAEPPLPVAVPAKDTLPPAALPVSATERVGDTSVERLPRSDADARREALLHWLPRALSDDEPVAVRCADSDGLRDGDDDKSG